MRGFVLDEPELEFGAGGRHIDPRFGIASHGPLDVGTSAAPERIRVGIVGAAAAVEGVRSWLGRAREPLAAKPAKYPKQEAMFPGFPGFNPETAFRSLLVFDENNMRAISSRVFDRIRNTNPTRATAALVDAYMGEVAWLAETSRCDVIVCARPEWLDAPSFASNEVEDAEAASADGVAESGRPDFHDQLKAAALRFPQPLQIIRPETWDATDKPPKGVRRRQVQDPATRAWNLHTALYYKAGGVPWRLIRSYSDLATCYLGISFYKSFDGATVHTSVAQLFNERGEGVVVRGGPAAVLKEDRQPHLTERDAADLVSATLAAYRMEHRTHPARLVIHKSSRFTAEEQSGFSSGADDAHIDDCELIWVSLSDSARAFRSREHPPLRGTSIALAPDRVLVYTKGSVDFYGAYPGMHVPIPLSLRPVVVRHGPEVLAAETLALTKLNWNHSQLDAHLPITLHAANKIKAILRRTTPESTVARRYAHYM
jgi:hypothetical protein